MIIRKCRKSFRLSSAHAYNDQNVNCYSAKGMGINFVSHLLKLTSVAVENLTPSSGRVHLTCNRPCNLITLY